MERSRFDTLTRLLTETLSRRGVLALLGGRSDRSTGRSTVTAINETHVDALSRALDASGSHRSTLLGALLAALGMREHSNVRAGTNKKGRKRQQQCQQFARSDCNSIFPTGSTYNSACYGFLAGNSTLGAPCCPKAKKSPSKAAACMSDHRARYCEILARGITCGPCCTGITEIDDYYELCLSRVRACCQEAAPTRLSAMLHCFCPGCTTWPIDLD